MTDSEILTYAIECGMIDRTSLEHRIAMQNKQKYLEGHKYSIWQGKDGKWYTTLPCPGKKDGRRLIKRTEKSALEDAIVDFYESGEQKSPTFGKLFNEWIENKLAYKEICKGTYDRYYQDYMRYFAGTDFDNKPISEITEDDIETMLRETIIQMDLKRKQFAGLRSIIGGVFKYAKRQKYTNISISLFFQDLELSNRMFRRDKKNDNEQVFSEDETPILLKYLIAHPEDLLYLGIVLDFYTGLRTGELVALKFSDVENGQIHVQRQQVRTSDNDGRVVYQIVDYTKTENGDRYVYLTESAQKVIKRIKMLNPFGEYMFPGIKKHCFNNKLYRACQRCGITPRSMHKIRKTYGTQLIDSGVDDSLIMSQMGHRNIQTTRNYYYFARKNNAHQREQIEKAVNY